MRLRGRSFLWTQRLRKWLITCLPFSNQYLLHCCKYYGRTQYGRGSLVVLKLRIAFGWRLREPVGVRYFRKFGGKWFKDIFAMSAEHKSKRVWCLVLIRSNIESVGHRKCAGCWEGNLFDWWLVVCLWQTLPSSQSRGILVKLGGRRRRVEKNASGTEGFWVGQGLPQWGGTWLKGQHSDSVPQWPNFVLHRVIPNHTMCYHATTMAAAMGLTDRMFAIMATHTASEEGSHTNVGDIRWQSCPDPLCTHNDWCCVWHLIMWQAHLFSYLRNLYPMQFCQTINKGCFNLIEFPDWNNFLFLSEIPVVQMIIWTLFSTGYVFVGELIACHSGYPSCWDTCKILVTWRLVWYASCNVGIRVAIRRTLWPSETQRSYLGCCFYSVGWGM